MVKYQQNAVFERFRRYTMSKNTHLTLDERNYIEQELIKNTSFKEIALYL